MDSRRNDDDLDLDFSMYIVDGYSFRNMLGIIRNETHVATMILSYEKIEISFSNHTKNTLHSIVLHTKEFASYTFNAKDESDNYVEEKTVSFDTKEIFNTTKGIGRRDGIRIYCIRRDNKINVQPIKMSTKDPGKTGALFVKIIIAEPKRFSSVTYPDEPNIRVQAKDFADLCAQMGGLKCIWLRITGYKNGVVFEGVQSNQNVASINRFFKDAHPTAKGNINGSNINNSLIESIQNSRLNEKPNINLNIISKEEIITVKISSGTVKALSKIHNISPPGTLLKFTFLEEKPTRIESPIGIYGSYTVYIR